MDLATLPKIKTAKAQRRVGRGHSSGKGKTSGRGQKGQKARGKVRMGFEGGQTPLYKRLPFQRGKGNPTVSIQPLPINLTKLADFEKGTIITISKLVAAGIVSSKRIERRDVKILGKGNITVVLTIAVPISHKAQEKIEQAGGTVISTGVQKGVKEKPTA